MENVLREITIDDLPEVAKIYITAYGNENWNEIWTFELAFKRLCELLSNPHCKACAYLTNGQLAGCIICELLTWHTGNQLEVKELFVDVDFQRSGVGRKLINYLEILRSEYSITEIVLWTNKRPALLAFYQSVGFKLDSDTVRFSM